MFYVHGFDPRGPSPYHRIFTEEAERQGTLSGARYATGRRRNMDKLITEWTVEADHAEGRVDVRYVFLRWDDVARSLWTQGDGALWRQLWRSTGVLGGSGIYDIARKGHKAGYGALMLPRFAALSFLALLLLSMALIGWSGFVLAGLTGAPAALGLLAGIAPLALALPAWRFVDRRMGVSWTVRSLAFMIDVARDPPAALVERAQAFAKIIAAAANEESWDEIVIVGHSQGATVSMLLMEHLAGPNGLLAADSRPVALITLGQCVSTVLHLSPDSARFRAACTALRDDERIFWLDVTSPADGASACRAHPLWSLGEPAGRPVRRSPMFHASLAPDRFRHIKLSPFDYHFQYLKSTDAPRAYDYFRLTCGPTPVRDFSADWTDLVEEH